jgi:SAM-dependent methyltransferase
VNLTRARMFWQCAATFPGNKEDVYPDHAAAQEFDLAAGKRVLEYGCGGGSDAMSYLRRGAHVTFADIVPSNVGTAAHRIAAAGLAERAQGAVLERSYPLPFDDHVFDVVTSHGVLHHIMDPVRVLHEFRRVIAPDGTLYVMLYTYKLFAAHRETINKLVAERKISTEEAFGWCTDGPGCPWAEPYDLLEAAELLAEARFTITKTTETNDGLFATYRAVPV